MKELFFTEEDDKLARTILKTYQQVYDNPKLPVSDQTLKQHYQLARLELNQLKQKYHALQQDYEHAIRQLFKVTRYQADDSA